MRGVFGESLRVVRDRPSTFFEVRRVLSDIKEVHEFCVRTIYYEVEAERLK